MKSLAVLVASVAVLVGCSDDAGDRYVGMRIYDDTFIDSVEQYEEFFPMLCDRIDFAAIAYSPDQIERIGLRTLAINDSFDAVGVGILSFASSPEADAMRDFIAIHMDEAVIYGCSWLLDDWVVPGTRTNFDMDDLVVLPVRGFVGLP